MAFTRTWNAAYEAIPANGADALEGAERIRDLKTDIQERLSADHVMDESADDGEHVRVTLQEQASDPTNVTDKGFVYSKDVSGVTELFYKDSDGDVTQITTTGLVNAGFATGTKMLFQQTAAPIGWTKVTGSGNDNALRITTGTVTTGGASNFTSVFGTGKVAGSTALSIAQMPAHTHTFPVYNSGGVVSTAIYPASSNNISYRGDYTTASTGSGSGHNHSLPLDVKYTDVIIATKD